MNIFFREMKANRKSLLLWCIGSLLMIMGGMGKFAASAGSGQSMNELVAQMPKAVLAILGIGSLDLSTTIGFYGTLFLYVVIMGVSHAGILGSNIISKEERDKTSEFLMVKPVSRNKIITFKLLAAFVNILIFNIVSLVFSIVSVEQYGSGEGLAGDIVTLMAGMLILQLMFLLIGTAIASVSKNPKAAASLSTGIILVAFIIDRVIELTENLDVLKYFTPFRYFEVKNVINGGGLDMVFIILSALIILGTLYATYGFYRKRDLNV
jgi:ABC-2 type transport system permease protein